MNNIRANLSNQDVSKPYKIGQPGCSKNSDDKLPYIIARYMVKIKNEQPLQSIGSVK